jgi:uncharacterized membrane protein
MAMKKRKKKSAYLKTRERRYFLFLLLIYVGSYLLMWLILQFINSLFPLKPYTLLILYIVFFFAAGAVTVLCSRLNGLLKATMTDVYARTKASRKGERDLKKKKSSV